MTNSEDPPNPPSDDEFTDDAPTQIGAPTLSVVANNDEPEEDGEVTSLSNSRGRLTYIVESLLFAADRPLEVKELCELVGEPDRKAIEAAISTLVSDYANRGVQLHQAGSGYQFRTHPEHAGWVQKLFSQKPIKLSRSLLETLSIIAYRQPITRPDIDEIRGVDSGGTIKTLLERSLVRILGKKEEPGRPMLYGTTKEFLEFFHLRDLKDLPTLREFHELSEEHEAEVSALASVAPEGTLPEASEDAPGQPVSVTPRTSVATFTDDSQELAEIDALLDSVDVKEFKDPTPETSN